jgi:hypothetical protein
MKFALHSKIFPITSVVFYILTPSISEREQHFAREDGYDILIRNEKPYEYITFREYSLDIQYFI